MGDLPYRIGHILLTVGTFGSAAVGIICSTSSTSVPPVSSLRNCCSAFCDHMTCV